MWVLWRVIPVRWVIDFDDPSHSSAVTSSRTWIEPPWLTRPIGYRQLLTFPRSIWLLVQNLFKGLGNPTSERALLDPACLKFESFKLLPFCIQSKPLSRSWNFSMAVLSVSAASYGRNVQIGQFRLEEAGAAAYGGGPPKVEINTI